jgi:putative flavoprotein involved in K+ transport
MESVGVAIIGGGQAGLAVSCMLAQLDVDHVVLERGRVGQRWRDRWDSFCLVTPNWSIRLPDVPYGGPYPDGYLLRDEIASYLEQYAAGFAAPVREQVEVRSVDSVGPRRFVLRSSAGDLAASAVVVATGAYQRAHRPRVAESLPSGLMKIDSDSYRNEQALPPGRVLIVGSGQSGCQIAEELRAAGRDVVLACGRAPWLPRRIGDHDFIWWAVETGYLDAPVDSLPDPAARLTGNILATGRDGGHDLHLRTLQQAGVTLAGRLLGVVGHRARFADDLQASVAWGDERYRLFGELIGKHVRARALEPVTLPAPPPFDADPPEEVDLRSVGAVVFATGFRPDYTSWLPWPEAFDELGFPIHDDGASRAVPGLYFAGVHFLRKRKSSLLLGVGEDAAMVAHSIAGSMVRA